MCHRRWLRRGPRSAPPAAWGLWLALLAASCDRAPTCAADAAGKGRLERINGYLVVHLEGTPEEIGEQHGRLLKAEIKRVVADVFRNAVDNESSMLRGAMKMEAFLPEDFRRELRSLAKAAEVEYEPLVAIQLFGDVKRAQMCTFYAAFDEATRAGEPIIGRNMEYYDYGVSDYGFVLIHFRPDQGIPFVTLSWAGVINGWTAMNEKGIVAANNTAYGTLQNSLEGLSTCFMLRKIVQYAGTVEEGIAIVKAAPRSCGTVMLIGGGYPPDAVAVEYDHKEIEVCRAKRGVVVADNTFSRLYCQQPREPDPKGSSRYDVLWRLIGENYGKIDREMNFAAAEGVPISALNLHSALLFPKDLRLRVAMGSAPACRQPYRKFRMTPKGIVSDE